MIPSLDERTQKYVNPQNPLGPADAFQIKDAEVAARLFDPHNLSFNSLLRKDISVVIGRRGSGKTALLNSYLYRQFLPNSVRVHHHNPNFDFNDYQVIVDIRSNELFEYMHGKLLIGSSTILRPIESVIEEWNDVLSQFIMSRILETQREKIKDNLALQMCTRYLAHSTSRLRDEARDLVWGPSLREMLAKFINYREPENAPSKDDAMVALDRFLLKSNNRAVIIFDSLDEYEVGEPTTDRIVGALLRHVGQFNLKFDAIKVKLGLPSEIFPEIQRASANPLKDFVNFDQVRWTSIELAQIAAYRFRLFLQMFAKECFSEIENYDLNTREGVRRFWSNFFPNPQKNKYGKLEDPMTYMIRHTQLLPRQLFRILQRVILVSHERTKGYGLLTSDAVSDSILNMEPIIAGEIIGGFKRVYPFAENLCRAIFANLPTALTYDQLEDKWRKIGRTSMGSYEQYFEMVNFAEMLLRMGIIGVAEEETDRYIVGNFAYSMLIPFAVGERMNLVVHPIFSRYFSCAGNKQKKSVLPQGAAWDGSKA